MGGASPIFHSEVAAGSILVCMCQQYRDGVHTYWLQQGTGECHGACLCVDVHHSGRGSTAQGVRTPTGSHARGCTDGVVSMGAGCWWVQVYVYCLHCRQGLSLRAEEGLPFSVPNFIPMTELAQGWDADGSWAAWLCAHPDSDCMAVWRREEGQSAFPLQQCQGKVHPHKHADRARKQSLRIHRDAGNVVCLGAVCGGSGQLVYGHGGCPLELSISQAWSNGAGAVMQSPREGAPKPQAPDWCWSGVTQQEVSSRQESMTA